MLGKLYDFFRTLKRIGIVLGKFDLITGGVLEVRWRIIKSNLTTQYADYF